METLLTEAARSPILLEGVVAFVDGGGKPKA
jgi:hypothetical protein